MGNILSSSSEFEYSIIDKNDINTVNNDNINLINNDNEFMVITEQPKKQEKKRSNKINYKDDNINKTCCHIFNHNGFKNKYNILIKKHDILIEKHEKLKKEYEYLLNKKNI
jgi:hypothetical protein